MEVKANNCTTLINKEPPPSSGDGSLLNFEIPRKVKGQDANK